MGMFEGINDAKSSAQFGNRGDICALCLEEKVGKEKEGFAIARNKLKGMLEGKKVIRVRESGTSICICLGHIHKIAKQNPLEEGDELQDDKK